MLAAALNKVRGSHEVVEQANQEAVPSGTSSEIARMIEMERETEQRLESQERVTAIEITLQAMRQIAQYCAGLPGRKALLWASSGFPFTVNEASMIFQIVGPRLDSYATVSQLYEETWKDLNQAQVAVYPIDARGLVNPTQPDISMAKPRPEFYSQADWLNEDTLTTFRAFAQATGGRAFYNTNDLAGAFREASDDNRSYYLLGYYIDRSNKRPGWHRLAVKVSRPGSQVRARSGFFLTEAPAGHANEDALKLALTSPLDYTAIPITGHWQEITPAPERGKRRVLFLLTLPANSPQIDDQDGNHMRLQFAAVALTETGATRAVSAKPAQNPRGAATSARGNSATCGKAGDGRISTFEGGSDI